MFIVSVVAPHLSVGVERVTGKVVIVLAVLLQFLEVVLHELFPKPDIHLVDGRILEAQVADEVAHLEGWHIEPVVAGGLIDKIITVTLIAETPVEVPDWSEDVLAGVALETLAIAESALRVVELVVERDFVDHHETDELFDVDKARDVLIAIEGSEETIEVRLDGLECQTGCAFGKLGFLDVDGKTIGL